MKRAASAERNSRSSVSSRRSSAARRRPVRRYVICVRAAGYRASLEVGKVYLNLGAPRPGPADHLRVVDESGEDYVYPKDLFRAIALPAPVQRALAHATSAA
jgi:hypothetical protein